MQWHAEQLAQHFIENPEALQKAEAEEATMSSTSQDYLSALENEKARKLAANAKWEARTTRKTGKHFRNKYKLYADKYGVPVLYESQITPETVQAIDQSQTEITKRIAQFERKKRRGANTSSTK